MLKEPLLGKSPHEVKLICQKGNLPSFAAKQICEWIYKKRAKSFSEMTNLSLASRQWLAQNCFIGNALPIETSVSADGTKKYLFPVSGGRAVETVFIPDGDRATLCVSSQVGCRMGCKFCMTGRQGLEAQLSAVEILNQVYSVPDSKRLTNVVFMGQGEPMDNVEAVIRACTALTADWGFAWSPGRITVSSIGETKGLLQLLKRQKVNIAISLHNAIPQEREQMMPSERAFPIGQTISLLREQDFCRKTSWGEHNDGSHQRRLSFEYTLFDGVNDSLRHAQALLALTRGLRARVNLIKFHPIPNSSYKGASDEKMRKFRDYLTAHGLFTTIRASRGQDILAACGLLSTAHKHAADSECNDPNSTQLPKSL